MSILTRSFQKIFGATGGTGEFGQIGSKAAGSPVTTKNLETIQALSNYDLGLNAIVSDQGTSVLPYLEDINSLFFLTTSQLAYLMQSGVPEWDDSTEYYKDISFVLRGGILWKDIFGTGGTPNLNFDPLTNLAKWKPIIDATFVDSGTPNAYILDPLSGMFASQYVDGMRVHFKVASTNSSSSSVNIASLGIKPITHPDGSALTAGVLIFNEYVTLIYNLSSDRFEIKTLPQVIGVNLLADGANILSDFSLGNVHTVTLGGNRTLNNPTNKVIGEIHTWIITQDGTGDRTLAFGTDFNFFGAGVIRNSAGERTVIRGLVTSTSSIECTIQGGPRTTKAFWHTVNGYGSSSTKIQKFTTEVDASDDVVVTIDNSATLGFTITANMDCKLSVMYTSVFAGGARFAGLSLNSSELTTGIEALTNRADRLVTGMSEAANTPTLAVLSELILSAGDIVRPHNGGTTANGTASVGAIIVSATEIL